MFISLLSLSPAGIAVTVTGLYQAEIPVTNQSSSQRQSAVRAAFIQIMVKLTGNRNAGSIYGVDELVPQAEQFVQQYEYRNQVNEEGIETTRLWVQFDQNVVDNRMREYNIPVWSQERPSTLVWLVINDDLGQRFASLDEYSRYFAVLQEQARARGISFITPLFDLQDAAAISTNAIVAGDTGAIEQASSRYQPDAILAGVVNAVTPELWEGNWISIVQQQNLTSTGSGDSLEIVLSEGVDAHADQLAARFADTQGFVNETTEQIRVTGIRHFEDYAKTLSYLESLNFVSAVDVSRVDVNQVEFVLQLRASNASLSQALSLGRLLQPGTGVNEYRYTP